MSSFSKIRERNEKLVVKLSDIYGIRKSLVSNIIQYVMCLVKADQKDIEELVFLHQMEKHFDLTNSIMLSEMYRVLRKQDSPMIDFEDVCGCICTFITTNLDIKIDFVFKVYDLDRDGRVSRTELYTLLKDCCLNEPADDLDPNEDSMKELWDIIQSISDHDKIGYIDVETFRKLVKQDIMYLELLGKCLPTDARVNTFVRKIDGKSPGQVYTIFKKEKFGLQPPRKMEKGFYPFELDLF